MSWGERACRFYSDCPIPERRDIGTCNTSCREYEWDGRTKPDTEKQIELLKEMENEPEDFFQE